MPSMCNGHNHRPGCRCGFGGQGHTGGGVHHGPPKTWVERPVTLRTPVASQTYASYINPNAKCPVCEAAVFFYQCHGGRVFFDELGPPWPKHPCTSRTSERVYVDSDTDLLPLIVEEPESKATTVPQWQREGWEAFHCISVSRAHRYSYHEHCIKGILLSTGDPFILYTTMPSYDRRKQHIELMMVKCICRRAERYLCEVAEISKSRVTNFHFTAYPKIEMRFLHLGWSIDYLNPYYDVFTELNELAGWFIYTTNLPLSPFILAKRERVHNPTNYYEGLHISLAKLTANSDNVFPSGIRLIAKLRSLRDYVQTACNGED